MKQLLFFLHKYYFVLFLLLSITSTGCRKDTKDNRVSEILPVPSGSIQLQGELAKRIQKSEHLLSDWEERTQAGTTDFTILENKSQISFPQKADKIFWEQYQTYGMTENHENYNSFHKYDGQTDPATVIRSFLYATRLWQKTRQERFRDEAELIYYNGICHLQQSNGHWGSDNTPGNKLQDVCLKPVLLQHSFEKTHDCTEGLHQIADLSYFIAGTTLYIPFLRENRLEIVDKNKKLTVYQQTNYPFENKVDIIVENNSFGIDNLIISAPQWTKDHQLFINGEKTACKITHGFLNLKKKLKEGDLINLRFTQTLRFTGTLNKENTNLDQIKIYYGPLLLGYSGLEVIKLTALEKIVPVDSNTFFIKSKNVKVSPIYRFPDDDKLNTKEKKQILF